MLLADFLFRVSRRKPETTPLELLGKETKAGSVPGHQFQIIASAIEENEERSGQRILFQHALDQGDQAVEGGSFFVVDFSKINKTRLGICAYELGQYTGLLRLPKGHLFYNEQSIYNLNDDFMTEWNKEVDGIISDVFVNGDMIVIIHEIGAVCYTLGGDKIWDIATDIIEDFDINEEILVITSNGCVSEYLLLDGTPQVSKTISHND